MTKFKIGTHSGPFHADDVFAVAILLAVLGGYTKCDVIRSRDQKVLETCDYLVDVGGEYDLAACRFDHHFANPPLHPETGEKLASAGLVWRAYGPQITYAYDQVYKGLIRAVDAYDTGSLESKGHFTVAQVIAGLNPEWDEPRQDFDGQFRQAVRMAQGILENEIRRAEAKVRAKLVAQGAIDDANGAPIVVTERYAPIMEELIDLAPNAKFWVYPGPGGDCWMVQCVPPSKGSFAQRLPLLAQWAGLRDGELAQASGVADATFVHPGRFIGGAKSEAGAIALAKATLAAKAVTV